MANAMLKGADSQAILNKSSVLMKAYLAQGRGFAPVCIRINAREH